MSEIGGIEGKSEIEVQSDISEERGGYWVEEERREVEMLKVS